MALWDKIKGEFVDIIEWTDSSNDTMVYRFERYGNEIKYGAKLVVRESQIAVFINQGKIADIFQPGIYTLETKNLPILSTLMGWKHGFESPFKAEVYFFNTKQFVDQKWGTKNPIMLRDPEFGVVRLRAFGTYAIRVDDASVFINEVVGTDGHFTTDEITNQLRNLVVSRFTDILGESKIPALDLAANYDEFGEFVVQKTGNEFKEYGIQLTKLLVENISLPPEVEKALDKRTSMGAIGNLDAYTKFQAANAMEKAAENPGGTASEGMGLGMGFVMANQLGQSMQGASQPASNQPPPPPGAGLVFHVAVNGQTTGPFDMNALQQQIASGQLNAQSTVWRPGMSGWLAAGTVPELANLFSAPPPPPPPPPPPAS